MTGPTYTGDEALREPVLGALAAVVDPEMALGIVDIGLVYAVRVDPERVHVTMTMTSPACPVTEVVAADIEAALRCKSFRDRIAEKLTTDPDWA